RDVIKPLEQILQDAFPAAQQALAKFENSLFKASEGMEELPVAGLLPVARKDGEAAQGALRQLHQDLEAIIQALEKVVSLARRTAQPTAREEANRAERALYKRTHEGITGNISGQKLMPMPPKP